MKKRILFISVLLISLSSAWAKYPLVRNFSRTTYQAGKQNWCITQNKDKKMYFANNEGLLEFDSNKWQLYPIANYTNVRSILYDSTEGKMYAGAFNEFGYYMYSNELHQLKYHSLSDSLADTERNFTEIWNISKDEKSIYFQGDNAIIRYTDGKMTTFPFEHRIDKSAVIYNTLIVSCMQTGVWSLSGDILFKFPNAELLTGKRICAILPFVNKQILFVTAFDGVFLFNGEEVVPYPMDITDFLKENQVFCATIQNEKIAFGTVLKGIVIKNIKDDSNIYINTYSGMQDNTVLSMNFDRDDNLWLGLDKGIDYVCTNTPISNLFSSNNLYGSGYASLVKEGILYLGTNQGLYSTPYPAENAPGPTNLKLVSQMQGQVWSLTEIDNTIFCGNDQGAFVIHADKPRRLGNVNGTWTFRELKHHPEHILACSYQGLYILKKKEGEWVYSHSIKGFNESGGMFEEDENGEIWFNHWMKGIYRLKLNQQLDSVASIVLYDTTKGLPVNQNNIINKVKGELIFSSAGGFYRYSQEEDRIVPYEKANQTYGSYTSSVRFHECSEEEIWTVSPLSICRLTKQINEKYQIDSVSYKSIANKLIVGFENFNFIDAEHILISTEDGFSYINTQTPKKTDTYAQIFIRSISSINQSDTLLYTKNEQTKDPANVHKYPFSLNSLRFEFIMPEYQDEAAIEYSYFLENYDLKWSIYAATNTKEYTKLDAGSYIFHVKAHNKISGALAETSFRFTILPPWYKTPWAFAVYGCLAISILYLTAHLFNRKSRKEVRKVRIEKEKQLLEQKILFTKDAEKKERQIIELKNKQLEFDLTHKSQELANSTMNLIRKNEILLKISTDIERLSADMKKEETIDCYRKLQVINSDIKENIEHDNDWQKFEENFDLVYDNYLERLSKEFPQLSVNDKRLCAYLKMNLSSKDIAPLLNISVRSVETTRYRLRKKMELNREVNLTEFLQRF